MGKNLSLKLAIIATGAAIMSGCTTTAEFAGMSTQKLCDISHNNFIKTQNTETVLSQQAIRRNANATKIQNAFNRLRPVADKFNSHNSNLPMNWSLAIIKKDTVNAWAMPCGYLGFYTGIVDKLNLTEAEVASIMGHEMAHALLEHSKQKYGAGLLMAIPAMAASLAGAGQFAVGALSTVGSVGGDLPFSRVAELEADVIGAFLMAQAGYDPRASLSAGKKLQEYGGLDLTPFLSTHPMGEQRVEALSRIMPEALKVYHGEKNIYTQMPDLKQLMKNKHHGHHHH